MEIIKNVRLTRILAIITFTLIILILLIISSTSPSNGYELSIYDAYPWFFWLFFISIMFLSVLIIIQKVLTEDKNNQWIFGFSAILIANFVLLVIPFFRGYCFYGGAGDDLFSHVGYLRPIIQSGYISEDNFYPIIHIFIKSISDILGVSFTDVIQFVPAFFSVLYIPFVFLLAKSISEKQGQALLITLFSFPLIYSVMQTTISPNFFSFVFIPLLLFLYHKRYHLQRKFEISILTIILCLCMVFFHPVTSIIAIIIFLTFITSFLLLKQYKSLLHNYNFTIKHHKITGILIILSVSVLAWHTSFRSGLWAISSTLKNILFDSDSTVAQEQLAYLISANLTIFQTIRLVILRYGPIIIYGTIALFCVIITLKKLVFSRKTKQLEFSYSLQFIAASLTSLAMIIGYFIMSNPIRASRYLLFITVIINGLAFYSLLKKLKNKKGHDSLLHVESYKKYFNKKHRMWINKKIIFSFFIIFIISFSCIVCTFNVYPSPVTWQGNWQFTHMDYAGSAWVVKNRDTTIQISSDVGFNLLRMEHYMNGISIGNTHIASEEMWTPTHFGYRDNNTISHLYKNSTTYIITSEHGKQGVNAFPENVQPEVHQWTEEDNRKLKDDINVIQIYSNSEFEIRVLNEK
jgi:hypothetical protein